ncbi:unnamed protein product [Cylindrotheca closterium]|uniref:ABC1 atypical kinase-like domain-containing protein n=1 Tax=Cylindrotheca closterium TaxID=2856 RepID=A0AAD2FHM0_9STRA|nr:unnamed protein product [Cylindrotheca closterium]
MLLNSTQLLVVIIAIITPPQANAFTNTNLASLMPNSHHVLQATTTTTMTTADSALEEMIMEPPPVEETKRDFPDLEAVESSQELLLEEQKEQLREEIEAQQREIESQIEHLKTEKQQQQQQEEHKGPSMAASRALRLFDIVFNDIIAPIYTTLIQRGLPPNGDWDQFWGFPWNGKTLADQCVLALEKMGPTYVKFGQALASRPDIVPRSLAQSLRTLQDSMQPFDTLIAKEIIQQELANSSASHEEDIQALVSSLSDHPVAAASIGQVYSGHLANGQKVAIKVQRPGIREIVQQDASLLHTIVQMVEPIPALPGLQKNQERLVETNLKGAVDEFMSRIVEELDYRNEANNIQTFHQLYSHRRPTASSNRQRSSSSSSNENKEHEEDNRIEVVVPEVYMDLCTDQVIVMEWIEGTHLVDLETDSSSQESLALIQQCIECTLSQLLDTGVLHADPHGGNLLKVTDTSGEQEIKRLGYIDFGLLSTVPVQVRDGLVCAVAELVFARNVTAVANLFGELQLLPEDIVSDPSERMALTVELQQAMAACLKYEPVPSSSPTSSTTIPSLRFDKLLDALTRLVPRFRFQLPPYFINNARALGTLEGMAREINPDFNVLQTMYPYILGRLLSNPTNSPIVEATVQSLIRSPVTGKIDMQRIKKLVQDATVLTGYSKKKVILDVLQSRNGPRLAKTVAKEQLKQAVARRLSFVKRTKRMRL